MRCEIVEDMWILCILRLECWLLLFGNLGKKSGYQTLDRLEFWMLAAGGLCINHVYVLCVYFMCMTVLLSLGIRWLSIFPLRAESAGDVWGKPQRRGRSSLRSSALILPLP